jgi:hypothetical protein
MWQFLGDHYNLLLGLSAGLIWLIVVVWFLQSSGFLGQWRDQWRERRKREGR